jgi:uncharacterized protein (TIGR02391 family)
MNSSDIASLVPNPDDLLKLNVEEQGRLLLKLFASSDMNESTGLTRSGQVNQHNFFNRANDYAAPPKYGSGRQKEVDKALSRAWAWLEREGLLVKDPSPGQNWFFLIEEGRELGSREDATAYRRANLLPTNQLHQLIAGKVSPAFLRGEYDTAIFQAFREIEIAVRQAGKLPQDLVGEKLMRRAFAPADGSSPAGLLTDMQLPPSEQQAMSHLFAGAFGVYRNSAGHRHVPTEPVEAAEVIMFASQLLRIVDRIKPE